MSHFQSQEELYPPFRGIFGFIGTGEPGEIESLLDKKRIAFIRIKQIEMQVESLEKYIQHLRLTQNLLKEEYGLGEE